MNDYILAALKNNEFKIPISFTLFDVKIEFNAAKIDTGAVHSLIPLRTIRFSDNLDLDIEEKKNFYPEFKKLLLDRKIPYRKARGINYTGEEDNQKAVIDRADIVFSTEITNLKVQECSLENSVTGISCDTVGNVLIGMNILKNFDFHCDVSRITEEYIFLGCLKNEINSKYLEALETHFGHFSNASQT